MASFAGLLLSILVDISHVEQFAQCLSDSRNTKIHFLGQLLYGRVAISNEIVEYAFLALSAFGFVVYLEIVKHNR